jgi:hypothetical protein
LSGYEQVAAELAKGTDPALLCATCPWDRNCLNPPSMSTEDVNKVIDEAASRDEARMLAARASGQPVPVPATTITMAAVCAGRDTALQACPVLAARLRSADGRKAAEAVKKLMQSWDES